MEYMTLLGHMNCKILIKIKYNLVHVMYKLNILLVWNGIRIKGSDTSGRIEVKAYGKWWYICDSDWTKDDADIACRQMEFDGAVSASNFVSIVCCIMFTHLNLYNIMVLV